MSYAQQTHSAMVMNKIRALGPISPTDSIETKRKKLAIWFDLSDALASEGMELWSSERIEQEVDSLRGSCND